ncbi:unnamed protein product [Calypogeia fissa]
MAAFQALRTAGSGGALAVFTGFLSGGVVFAAKKAVAAEGQPPEAAISDVSKPNVSEDGRSGVTCAPQSDGVECIETISKTDSRRTVKATGTESWNLSVAPQFDGLECFETIVSTGNHAGFAKQPVAIEKPVPKNRGLAIAPQFDGLHCFETFVSRR